MSDFSRGFFQISSNIVFELFGGIFNEKKPHHDEAFIFDSLLISIPSQGAWNKKLERLSTWAGRLRVFTELLGEVVYTEVVGHIPAGKHHEIKTMRIPHSPIFSC